MAGCARRPVNTCLPVRIPNIRSVIAAGMARQGMSMDITASALLLRAERVIPVIQISHIPQTYRIQGCVKSRGPKPVRQTRTVRQRRGALTDGASSGNDALSQKEKAGNISRPFRFATTFVESLFQFVTVIVCVSIVSQTANGYAMPSSVI